MNLLINQMLNQKQPVGDHEQLIDRVKKYIEQKRDERTEKAQKRFLFQKQLREAGLSKLDVLRPEILQLADMLVEGEKVIAAVCGRTKTDQSVLLALTKYRVIYLNQVPFYSDMDEVSFASIGGISMDVGLWSATVCIFTGIGEFVLQTMNVKAAENFVDWIERTVLVNKNAIGLSTFMKSKPHKQLELHFRY